MKQTVLVSFSDDIPLLTALHHCIPSTLDLWTLPFHRRNEAINANGYFLIAVTTLRPQSPEGLNQLSVLKTEFPWLPVILIAKDPDPDEIITAFKLGAEDLLILPMNTMKIMESIRQIQKRKLGLLSSIPTIFAKTLNYIRNFFNDPSNTDNRPKVFAKNETIEQISPPVAAGIIATPNLSALLSQPEGSQKLRVNLLGKFEITFNGRSLKEIPAKKERSLLAYMLFHHNRDLNKEKLMDKFWSDSTPSSARNCLNVTIHKVRKCLQKFSGQEEVIIYKDECYLINPEIDIELDVTKFLQFWKKGRSEQNFDKSKMLEYFQQAVDLYRGDFMEHMLYEKWAEAEREKIKDAYLYMLNALSKYHFQKGQISTTMQLTKKMLEKDNCLEEVHRLLMKCYLIENQKDKAIRQYYKCKDVLKKELEVSPSEATKTLYDQIRG